MIHELKKIHSAVGGKFSINTLIHYYNIYLKFQYYRQKGEPIMQCYTNCSIECCTCEITVQVAVKVWKKIVECNS